MTPAAEPTAACPPHEARLRGFAWRGLRTAGFALVIALCLWLLFPQSLLGSVVYSLCIALSCWLLIDGSRILAALWSHRHAAGGAWTQSLWPGWGWMIPIVLVGSVLGYAIGNELANALLGKHAPGPFNADGRQIFSVLVLAMLPAVVITYVFHTRETLANQLAMVRLAERQAAEQQLKLLESQLEPHMLFNTLANLRALIGVDAERAQAMLDRLIAFLRASLAGSRQRVHPLAAEFERLRDYIALMQVRMGDRLAVAFDLPAELAAAEVPPLLLQPLVENSVKHGLEPKVGPGRIEVSAAREGRVLVLRVRDTGAGPVDVQVRPDSFGLAHVRERLATLYGDAASFELAAAGDAAGGAVATVRLPLAETAVPRRTATGGSSP